MKKTIIGLTEKITLFGIRGKKKIITARIDTGASTNSVDVRLAAELNLGPITRTKFVKHVHGNKRRAVVKAKIKIAGKEIISEFTLADREHMTYPVLIGQNILKKGFIINPTK